MSQEERAALLRRGVETSGKTLEMDPTWTEASVNMATSLLHLSELTQDPDETSRLRQQALESIGEAIRLLPEEADFHLIQGQIHHRLGNASEARASLERALKLKPKLAERHADLVSEIRG